MIRYSRMAIIAEIVLWIVVFFAIVGVVTTANYMLGFKW